MTLDCSSILTSASRNDSTPAVVVVVAVVVFEVAVVVVVRKPCPGVVYSRHFAEFHKDSHLNPIDGAVETIVSGVKDDSRPCSPRSSRSYYSGFHGYRNCYFGYLGDRNQLLEDVCFFVCCFFGGGYGASGCSGQTVCFVGLDKKKAQ